jgi:hypothetical protein
MINYREMNLYFILWLLDETHAGERKKSEQLWNSGRKIPRNASGVVCRLFIIMSLLSDLTNFEFTRCLIAAQRAVD